MKLYPVNMTTASSRPLRIGTRGSLLALEQTRRVVARLKATFRHLPPPEVVTIRTTGDRIVDRPLADVGGKGLFAKEIESALLDDEIDFAVHSLKDLETFLPPRLVIAATLPRDDPRDAIVANGPRRVADLKRGARVATSSVRREAILRSMRPDLRIVPLRGNVNTRLERLDDGVADALILGTAGLERIDIPASRYNAIPADIMLPAAGQGIIALECRDDRADIRSLLALLDDRETHQVMLAERAMLATLDGSCRTPIGALATIAGDRLHLRGLVARTDGSAVFRTERRGSLHDAEALGRDAGKELLRRATGVVALAV